VPVGLVHDRPEALVAAWFVAFAFAVTSGLACAGQPIDADLGVETRAYETIVGLPAVETWNLVDGLSFWAIPREPPTGYYCSVDASSSEALRSSLHNLISPHTAYPYTNSSHPGDSNHKVDTWDIIALADAYPADSSTVLDIYRNRVFDRQYYGYALCSDDLYQREHSWPKAYGFKWEPPDSRPWENPAWVDCHHLFAAYCDDNHDRSNYPYASGDVTLATCRPTDATLGRGSSSGDDCNYLLDLVPGGSTESWQTWLGRRGDVARALFYMDIRYEGGTAGEANLELTDSRTRIKNSSATAFRTQETAYMGLLSTLLQWHADDPVDDLERRRNTVVFLFQGNRNPFIDHPEWVTIILGTD